MRVRKENNHIGKRFPIFAVTGYLLLAITICIFITYVSTDNIELVNAQQPGITDLTTFDFSHKIAEIATESTRSIYIYSGAFYTSEDFANGNFADNGVLYDRTEGAQGDYGTLRMELKLPPGKIYALAAKNVSYAQRLFIDGIEYPSVGIPGERIEDVIPQSRRFLQTFYPTGETTEVIIHYSAFVHADGGGLYPMKIGYAENVSRSEQLNIFRTAAVSAILGTIMVFFFGLFLFFRSHRYLFWFSLLCGCIAIRLLGEKALGVLCPDLNWYLIIRIAYISNCFISLLSMLYIRSLFPDLTNKWVVRGVLVFFGTSVLLIALTPTTLFTRFPVELSLIYAVIVGYILLAALVQYARGKLSSPLSLAELRLLLVGLFLFIVFSVLDIFTFQRSLLLFGLEYQTVGMIVFLFINMLALVLGFSHAEQQLDILRKREWEITETNQLLERLNRAKNDFLGNISHEMKTPLTVISNCAGVTLRQFRRNAFTKETEKNLDDMQHEAIRLGKLVEQLLAVSMEKERQLTLSDTDAKVVLERAADFCSSICWGRRNQIKVENSPQTIPLQVNLDSIFQVLVNLIGNASRQMKNGVITLSAQTDDNRNIAVLLVNDQGDGIPPELLPRVFERGVSGSNSTGLGLAICEEIVREHGGKMGIDSSNCGTTVWFTLPCVKGGPVNE